MGNRQHSFNSDWYRQYCWHEYSRERDGSMHWAKMELFHVMTSAHAGTWQEYLKDHKSSVADRLDAARLQVVAN